MNGILMRPWKLRAIAESSPDREWQTRRTSGLKEINDLPSAWECTGTDGKSWGFWNRFREVQLTLSHRYRVGEVVYLKEAHYAYGHWDYVFDDHDDPEDKGHWEFQKDKDTVIHFADSEWQHALTKPSATEGWYKRSPLFLPERFARHFIKITGVKPERLQNISTLDCLEEGYPGTLTPTGAALTQPYHWYHNLWDDINGKGSFETNPFVWVYTFKKTGERYSIHCGSRK